MTEKFLTAMFVCVYQNHKIVNQYVITSLLKHATHILIHHTTTIYTHASCFRIKCTCIMYVLEYFILNDRKKIQ